MESTRYLNHPLNKSTAKATFSFSRSQRLPKTNKILNHSFYDLPSMRSQRACSLGVGNKSNLVNKAASPPPGTYDPKLGFNQANKSSMIGFGKGRAEVTFGNFLNDSIRAKNLPAPNRYRVNFSTFSKRCGLISERIKNDTEMSQAKQLPGPGTYSPTKIDIKDTGSFLVSKYKNFGSPRYHNPQQQTPKRHRTESELGPLSYNTNHISFVNRSVLSKFKNSGGSSFPRSERSGLIDKSKLETPGFVYATYSQFGTAQ